MKVLGAAALLIALAGCSGETAQPVAQPGDTAEQADAITTPIPPAPPLETFAFEAPLFHPRNFEFVKRLNDGLDAGFDRLAIKLRVRDMQGFETLLSDELLARPFPKTNSAAATIDRTAFMDQWEATFADWRRLRDVELHVTSRRLGDGTQGVARLSFAINGMDAHGNDVNVWIQARVRTTGNLLEEWAIDRWEWDAFEETTRLHEFAVHHHDMALHPVDSHQDRETVDGGGYAAIIVGDVDRDGAFDVFAPGPNHSPLFVRRDDRFVDEAEQRGLAAESGGAGGVFADLDGDGQDDLLVTKLGYTEIDGTERGNAMRAYVNRAGHFARGFPTLNRFLPSFVAVPFDLGLDGDLDVFVGGYGIDRGPHSATASSGARDALFENDGTGAFRDVASEFGVASSRWCRSASVFDHDADGDLDLYVANERGDDRLWSQDFAARKFVDAARHEGWARSKRLDSALSVDDVDGDGALDLFADMCPSPNADCGFGTLALSGDRFDEGEVRSMEFDGQRLWSAVVGDWDLDGRADLLTIGRALNDHRTEHT